MITTPLTGCDARFKKFAPEPRGKHTIRDRVFLEEKAALARRVVHDDEYWKIILPG